MPTTCQRFWPDTTVSPTFRFTNCPFAPRPTITSLVPNRNIRPSMIDTSGRSVMPSGSMPRIGTFADESGDDFFGRSMIDVQLGGRERVLTVAGRRREPA